MARKVVIVNKMCSDARLNWHPKYILAINRSTTKTYCGLDSNSQRKTPPHLIWIDGNNSDENITRLESGRSTQISCDFMKFREFVLRN